MMQGPVATYHAGGSEEHTGTRTLDVGAIERLHMLEVEYVVPVMCCFHLLVGPAHQQLVVQVRLQRPPYSNFPSPN